MKKIKNVLDLRSRIYNAFKNKKYKKASRTYILLGAEFDTVKYHIEKQFTHGMCWELMGHLIHIDHIIPLASAKTEEELMVLFHYTNLQPLWAEDNLRKNCKY